MWNGSFPIGLEHPLTPSVAAELEGVVIDLEVIQDVYQQRVSQYDLMLVEGVGGLLAPLYKHYYQCGFNPAFKYSPDCGGP